MGWYDVLPRMAGSLSPHSYLAIVGSRVRSLLFVVAVVVFFLGLGIGLAFNPIIGLILWVVAPAIAVSNCALDTLRPWALGPQGANRLSQRESLLNGCVKCD